MCLLDNTMIVELELYLLIFPAKTNDLNAVMCTTPWIDQEIIMLNEVRYKMDRH